MKPRKEAGGKIWKEDGNYKVICFILGAFSNAFIYFRDLLMCQPWAFQTKLQEKHPPKTCQVVFFKTKSSI